MPRSISPTFSGTGTTGSINVSGGELQVGRRILIAANAASRVGNLTLSGSGIIRMVATGSAGEGDLGMLRLGSGVSTLNFDGGELIGRGIHQSAASATSNIYYNGTKFTLNGNSGTGVSALIGSGGTAVNQIKNGGLKIDTAGFNATIARGLANFTGHTGVLTKEGAGTLTMAAGGQQLLADRRQRRGARFHRQRRFRKPHFVDPCPHRQRGCFGHELDGGPAASTRSRT